MNLKINIITPPPNYKVEFFVGRRFMHIKLLRLKVITTNELNYYDKIFALVFVFINRACVKRTRTPRGTKQNI